MIWGGSVFRAAAIPAREQQQGGDAAPGLVLFNIIWSLVPYLLILVILWPLVRMIRKNQKRSEEYMAAMAKHNEKVRMVTLCKLLYIP